MTAKPLGLNRYNTAMPHPWAYSYIFTATLFSLKRYNTATPLGLQRYNTATPLGLKRYNTATPLGLQKREGGGEEKEEEKRKEGRKGEI